MGTQAKVGTPKRGEIYLVAFDPARGAEIKKTRPALVIQNDITNQWSPLTIVTAITGRQREKLYQNEVAIMPPEGGLEKPSVVKLSQIRTMDHIRLGRRLGVLSPQTMAAVDRALAISVGLWGDLE